MCDRFLIDKRLQSVIIDYRNDFMCHQVRRVVKTIPPESVCAIVVGKNHVDGMFANLPRGIEYSPESLKSGSGKASFMDQLLLAQLLRT
jgi:pheromone shutdown protein TraB